jgi:hypothetical protein
MLYDVHTHIGLDQGFLLRGWWPYAATAQDLLEAMDAHGTDRAVCFPFCLSSAYDPYAFADRQKIELLPGRVPYDRENPLLVQEVERIDTAKRLHVFAMFDPSRECSAQAANLEKLTGEIAGLKVQGTVIESRVAALLDEGKPIMEFAEAHRLPIVVHTSVIESDTWSQVRDCMRVADAYPKARFNLAHSLRLSAPLLREAADMPNVWIDCAAHLNHCQLARDNHPAVARGKDRVDADYSNPAGVLEAVWNLIPDKYLWGSDNPFQSWCDDSMRFVHSYQAEAAAFHALPGAIQKSMGQTAAEAWLFGRE